MKTLENVLAVTDYLNEQGYKCSKATVYNHVRQGRLIKTDEGKFSVKAVDKYAGLHLQRIDGGGGNSDSLDELQKEKLSAETKKAKAQASHWELKTLVDSGQYIDRDLFNGELAGRAAIFRNDLETFFRSFSGDMIRLVDGDAGMTPELIDFWLGKLEIFLGRYSEKKRWPTLKMRIEDGVE